MFRLLQAALCSFLFFDRSSGFVSQTAGKLAPSLALSMHRTNNDSDDKRVAASFLAAAYLFANVVSVAPAFADPMDDFGGSSQVVAARSGGRVGGRTATGSRGAPYSSTSTIRRTTVIQQNPSIVVSPSSGYGYSYGYGYDPTPGMALGLGLSAINSVGNGIREYSQDREIAGERAELNEARMKQAELEARLRALEAAPKN